MIKVDRLVPIDSKFPLDNFERMLGAENDIERQQHEKLFARDVKAHVDAIARQVHPARRGDVRLRVHVPPVGGDLLRARVREDRRAAQRTRTTSGSFPVSPTTLTAYLQVIVLGLKGLQIEQHAQEVMAYCSQLQSDFGKFKEDFELVGTHVGPRAEQVQRRAEAAGAVRDEARAGRRGAAELPAETHELPRAVDAA